MNAPIYVQYNKHIGSARVIFTVTSKVKILDFRRHLFIFD